MSCDSYTYGRFEYEETVVTEFNLVCDNNYLVNIGRPLLVHKMSLGCFAGKCDDGWIIIRFVINRKHK